MLMRTSLSTLFLFVFFAASAQVKITGRVTIESGPEAAIGASVQVKGSTTGAVTDIDGNYTVEVPDPKATLVFSYTGFTTQNVVVGSRTTVDITLTENAAQLSEVVVTGYGSQKRSSISGSVSTVGAPFSPASSHPRRGSGPCSTPTRAPNAMKLR